jgi:hypothetical protein
MNTRIAMTERYCFKIKNDATVICSDYRKKRSNVFEHGTILRADAPTAKEGKNREIDLVYMFFRVLMQVRVPVF